MAFKTDQIKLKEDYANDGAAGAPADGTLALIGATGSKELKIRDDGSWVAISGGGGGSLNNVVEDTTPQLGGELDANGNDIDMGTNMITDVKVGQWIQLMLRGFNWERLPAKQWKEIHKQSPSHKLMQ